MDAGSLAMFNVYIREAHPTDGWHMPGATPDGPIHSPKTLEERVELARQLVAFAGSNNLTDVRTLVDHPQDDFLAEAYEAGPERIVILDRSLEVVYFTGQGPFQYDLEEVETFIKERLNPLTVKGCFNQMLGMCN